MPRLVCVKMGGGTLQVVVFYFDLPVKSKKGAQPQITDPGGEYGHDFFIGNPLLVAGHPNDAHHSHSVDGQNSFHTS